MLDLFLEITSDLTFARLAYVAGYLGRCGTVKPLLQPQHFQALHFASGVLPWCYCGITILQQVLPIKYEVSYVSHYQ